jgi:hypothetical protein
MLKMFYCFDRKPVPMDPLRDWLSRAQNLKDKAFLENLQVG